MSGSEARSAPSIMMVPLSARDARPLLQALAGPVAPAGWQGALPFTYRTGPGPATVRVRVAMDDSVRAIWVVEGRIRGSELPDEYVVLGNHRDAWVFGGVDPSSGTATQLELARTLGGLAREGRRPRRCVVFASWDAEEWHLTGSTDTMENMIHHTQAVMRGCKTCLVVGDMPFMSYNTSIREAIINAGRLMKEAGCDAVKLEGGVHFAATVEAIVKAGIPVQGHIGLTPQTASALGGFKMQGKNASAAKQIIDDAKALNAAGAFSIILEAVPAPLGKLVSEAVKVPVIGIGAGPGCDGQVLVTHDMLGLFERFMPKFAKRYVNFYEYYHKNS